LKIKQLNVSVETKIKDNIFVNLVVACQYKILPDMIQNNISLLSILIGSEHKFHCKIWMMCFPKKIIIVNVVKSDLEEHTASVMEFL